MALNLDALFQVMSWAQVRSIVESQARINIWEGSIRSGKTIASLLRFLIYVATAPRGGELGVVGKTRESIGRNIFAPLQNPILFGTLAKQVHYTPGAPTATIFGRVVHVIGGNDAKAEPKVRGMTSAGWYVDEATVLPRTLWDALLGRMSVPGAKLFATTNPDNPGHWLRKDYLLRSDTLNLRTWHFTIDDNAHLDREYVESIKNEYVGLWYRRFILGEWVQAEGAVYDMWDPERHVVDIMPRIIRWYGAGIDYGTTNPFAAVLLGLGADSRLYLTHEYRYDSRLARRGKTNPEYSEDVRRWLDTADRPTEQARGIHPEWLYVDPSATAFSLQLYRDGMSNVANANNEVIPGIQTVAGLLGRGQLAIHSSCKGLIDEIGGYSWDDDAAAKGEDKPIKADDHSLDAVRYVVHSTENQWRSALPLAA